MQQVHCEVGVINQQYLFGRTVSIGALVQAEQVFKIAVKLHYSHKELPNRDLIMLFECFGDVIFHRHTQVVLEHGQQVECHTMEK